MGSMSGRAIPMRESTVSICRVSSSRGSSIVGSSVVPATNLPSPDEMLPWILVRTEIRKETIIERSRATLSQIPLLGGRLWRPSWMLSDSVVIVVCFLFRTVSDLLEPEAAPTLDCEIAGLLERVIAHPSIPSAPATRASFAPLSDGLIVTDEDQDRTRSRLNPACVVAGWEV